MTPTHAGGTRIQMSVGFGKWNVHVLFLKLDLVPSMSIFWIARRRQ